MAVYLQVYESLHATATILPSVEYVDEKHDKERVSGAKGVTLI